WRQCLLDGTRRLLCVFAFAPSQQNQSAAENENTETLYTGLQVNALQNQRALSVNHTLSLDESGPRTAAIDCGHQIGFLPLSHDCKRKGPGNRRSLWLLWGMGQLEKLTHSRYQRLAICWQIAGL